jgi:hypothetical protein
MAWIVVGLHNVTQSNAVMYCGGLELSDVWRTGAQPRTVSTNNPATELVCKEINALQP